MIAINKIKPNPNNPRLIKDDKFKKLVNSLRDFPKMLEKRPIVCVTDTDGKIYPLGGNMRFLALKELGYKEIPDNWVQMADDWNEDERKEFVIKDNVAFGDWDFEALADDWDFDELEKWGLDLPEQKTEEPENIGDFLETKFRLEIILDDEKTQELLYNEIISRGYECRILTL